MMAFLTHAVSFFLVMVLYIQLSNAQAIPERCRCPDTFSKIVRWTNIEEFSITVPRSRCKVTEIILTLKTVNSKTKEPEQRCIKTNTYQAEKLQKCWNRINKDGKRTIVKLVECEIVKNPPKEIENTTTIAQP